MSKDRILIVEDEQIVASLLKSFLLATQEEKSKYQIELAHNLSEAIEQIEKFLPDLIVTDLRLDKGLEGLAVFDFLEENNLKIPTIILTAYGDKENLLKCIEKRPHYLFEKARGFEELKDKITQIITEQKSKSRVKPHVATVKSLLDKLPPSQHFQLILDRIENFTLEEISELEDELPLLRLSIKEEQQEQKNIEVIDRRREVKGLVPLSLLNKGTIHCEKHSYKLKTTGERKVYPYFYLRWMDNGKHAGKFLGRLEKIEDPLVLEKIYQKYPEFKAKRLNKYS